MDGKLALAAWRWLFIFDLILAIPVALYGYVFYPGTPQTTTAFLTDWTKSALNKGSTKMVELTRQIRHHNCQTRILAMAALRLLSPPCFLVSDLRVIRASVLYPLV
jgi:hypothetical protein